MSRSAAQATQLICARNFHAIVGSTPQPLLTIRSNFATILHIVAKCWPAERPPACGHARFSWRKTTRPTFPKQFRAPSAQRCQQTHTFYTHTHTQLRFTLPISTATRGVLKRITHAGWLLMDILSVCMRSFEWVCDRDDRQHVRTHAAASTWQLWSGRTRTRDDREMRLRAIFGSDERNKWHRMWQAAVRNWMRAHARAISGADKNNTPTT